jgi:hypothetical protein
MESTTQVELHLDRGSLCPTYRKPFDLLVRGTKLKSEWRAVRDEFRNWLMGAA